MSITEGSSVRAGVGVGVGIGVGVGVGGVNILFYFRLEIGRL